MFNLLVVHPPYLAHKAYKFQMLLKRRILIQLVTTPTN
jgi:hypothetical protein